MFVGLLFFLEIETMDPILVIRSDILLNSAFLQKTVMTNMTNKRELAKGS